MEFKKKHLIVSLVSILLLFGIIGIGVGIGYRSSQVPNDQTDNGTEKPKPSPTILGNFSTAAVASEGGPCPDIGL